MKKPTSEKKPTSIGATRRINRKCTRQRDREIDQRHKAALKVLDQVEQRAIYDAAQAHPTPHARHHFALNEDLYDTLADFYEIRNRRLIMKILVACEESQAVTKEFRKLGHEAYSCDILPTSGSNPEWHLQQDVTILLQQHWDMIIAFPPCTYLSSSGMHWTTRGIRPMSLTEDALAFAGLFFNSNCPKVAIENPIGILSSKFRKPDQIIQPWMFGHDASKQTCLWLKGLPAIKPTKIIPPQGWCEVDDTCIEDQSKVIKTINGFKFYSVDGKNTKPVWGNQTPSGQNKLGPSEDRAKLRSKTFEGIAKALAEQYTAFELIGMVISTVIIVGAILFSIWLAS